MQHHSSALLAMQQGFQAKSLNHANLRLRRQPLTMRGPAVLGVLLSSLPGSAGVVLRGQSAPELTANATALANATNLSVALLDDVDSRLAFLHIPKNGGTDIEDAAQAHGVRWGSRRPELDIFLRMPDGHFCSGYHVPLSVLESNFNDAANAAFAKRDVFCVTRDPAERAVSEYRYLLRMPWGRGYEETQHTGLTRYPPCTKEGLNHFLVTTLHMIKDGERYIDDCHQIPQANFIWDESGKQLCHYILRQEELSNSFNQLMEQFGSRIRLAERANHSSSSKCPDISVSDLDKSTVELLKDVYAEDYRLLGYEPPH